MLKDVSADRLVDSILAAARIESFLHPTVAARVMAAYTCLSENHTPTLLTEAPVETLSEREIQVLWLLGAGASNKEITAALQVAEGTVKNHVTNVLGKLGVRDRTQAALQARALGLL